MNTCDNLKLALDSEYKVHTFLRSNFNSNHGLLEIICNFLNCINVFPTTMFSPFPQKLASNISVSIAALGSLAPSGKDEAGFARRMTGSVQFSIVYSWAPTLSLPHPFLTWKLKTLWVAVKNNWLLHIRWILVQMLKCVPPLKNVIALSPSPPLFLHSTYHSWKCLLTDGCLLPLLGGKCHRSRNFMEPLWPVYLHYLVHKQDCDKWLLNDQLSLIFIEHLLWNRHWLMHFKCTDSWQNKWHANHSP